ncbi:uncharacterized protein TRAVEDRAFT_32107, partial [Trametes versicolor FP-101664 SS1]|uniref:uncharacterized protein n=1 Tax=Trametes versicolor (strain FP-101664) TaxID=717944 RepID=UPI000462489F
MQAPSEDTTKLKLHAGVPETTGSRCPHSVYSPMRETCYTDLAPLSVSAKVRSWTMAAR